MLLTTAAVGVAVVVGCLEFLSEMMFLAAVAAAIAAAVVVFGCLF